MFDRCGRGTLDSDRMTGRRLYASVAGVAWALLSAGSAFAHDAGVQPADARLGPRAASAPQTCPGQPTQPDRVITGEFGTDLARSYVMLPFDVAAGTTAVRVKYCFDQPEALLTTPAFSARHTLDLACTARARTARARGACRSSGAGAARRIPT